MKIYFYGPDTAKGGVRESYEVIIRVLKRADVWLSSNLERQQVNLPPEDLQAAEALGQPLLEQMDALIIEGTDSDQQAGYLVALAITLRKPMLFLYQRGSVPQLFQHLTSRDLPKWIRVVAYTSANLEIHLSHFLGGVTGAPVREVPRIKFTLRITPSIERFLTFKTQNTKLRKADWLRAQIEKFMDEDETWKKFERREGPDTSEG